MKSTVEQYLPTALGKGIELKTGVADGNVREHQQSYQTGNVCGLSEIFRPEQ